MKSYVIHKDWSLTVHQFIAKGVLSKSDAGELLDAIFVYQLTGEIVQDLPNTVSFDRFDNDITYTYDNTFLVTSFINNAKASYGYDEFKKLMIEVCAYMDR